MSGVLGVILAGGLARRMGGVDKPLIEVAGKPLIAHVIERQGPSVEAMIVNANGDPARFDAFGLPVVADVIEGFAGPLAGVLTGLRHAEQHLPGCDWVLSLPADTPFMPVDTVARMMGRIEAEDAQIACAASARRTHPVVGLWPVALADELERALASGTRKIDAWTANYRLAVVEFAILPFDPFFNVNRPEDVEMADRLHQTAIASSASSAGGTLRG